MGDCVQSYQDTTLKKVKDDLETTLEIFDNVQKTISAANQPTRGNTSEKGACRFPMLTDAVSASGGGGDVSSTKEKREVTVEAGQTITKTVSVIKSARGVSGSKSVVSSSVLSQEKAVLDFKADVGQTSYTASYSRGDCAGKIDSYVSRFGGPSEFELDMVDLTRGLEQQLLESRADTLKRNRGGGLKERDIAKLNNSLYLLGNPAISTEHDKKLWKTIFASIDDCPPFPPAIPSLTPDRSPQSAQERGEPSKGDEEPVEILARSDVTHLIVFTDQQDGVPNRTTGGALNEGSPCEEMTVRGGEIDALIAYLTQPHTSQSWMFYEAFLTTYRTFISPEELLRKVIHRYSIFSSYPSNSNLHKISANCFYFILRITNELRSESMTANVRKILQDFQCEMVASEYCKLALTLRELMEDRASRTAGFNVSPADHILSFHVNLKKRKGSGIFEFKTSVIAEQLTYYASELFNKIDLPEILTFAKKRKDEVAPNMDAFVEHANILTPWAATLVLRAQDQGTREKVHSKILKIMKHLKKLNNFHSCFSLMMGLMFLDKLDWPKGNNELLQEFVDIFSPHDSYKTYRAMLGKSLPPCIPLLAVVLRDLAPIETISSSLPDKPNHINFVKRYRQYLCLNKLREAKTVCYSINKNDAVQKFFSDFRDVMDENELHDSIMSLKSDNHR